MFRGGKGGSRDHQSLTGIRGHLWRGKVGGGCGRKIGSIRKGKGEGSNGTKNLGRASKKYWRQVWRKERGAVVLGWGAAGATNPVNGVV